jgi:NAD(P)-dependent dehydrogenase (short-subunit alcohol dehydrogenase family)
LDPSGKIAVVTGAGKGIGLAVTKALVDAGAYVVGGAANGQLGIARKRCTSS